MPTRKPKTTRNSASQDFDSWMRDVNYWCMQQAGVSVHDLPDCTFADWHADGMAPKVAAKRAVKAASE